MKKIALVHDWLVTVGGAEKVLEGMYEIYPHADIFTLVQDKSRLKNSILNNANITSSFIQKLPLSKKNYRNYLPFFPLAIEQFDLSSYDVVISSSHAVAKGVLTTSNQLHISYIHTPMRYAWDLYFYYIKQHNMQYGFKSWLVRYILHKIRIWDIVTINRVDFYIANSKYVARRIKKIYNKDSIVIYPPVDIQNFTLETKKEDYYLTASRLVPYKRIDLIVEAFAKLADKRLIIIGDGPEMDKIKQSATINIEILGYQSLDRLITYMQKAKAFIFAAEEDFGIIPVEAQACGTPVIAFGRGGVKESVIENKTGLFFDEQTVESLIEAIYRFESIEDHFDPIIIRKHAQKFSKERFQNELYNFIQQKSDKFFQ